MRKLICLTALLVLVLTACGPRSSGGAEPSPTVDAVATQVAIMLTEMPTFTAAPPQADTATLAPVNTATSTATVTITPTVTVTLPPTETPSPTASGDPAIYLGEPDWKNTFDSGRAFGVIDNENTRIVMDNGALALTGVNANGWLGWSMTFSQEPKDFYLDATFTTLACSGADQYGLVFRAPNTSAAYFFGVTCDGDYFLEANDFTENGSEAVILANTFSPLINAGANQTNRLGVMAQGDHIKLYANGALLTEATDGTFLEAGYFGAFVAAYATPGFTVRMEEISLWNLP